MQIEYKKFGRKKLAIIWLTNEEQQIKTAEIKELTKQLAAENYMTVIFRSGGKDLKTYTQGLLKQNISN